jgi:hypothetical protein
MWAICSHQIVAAMNEPCVYGNVRMLLNALGCQISTLDDMMISIRRARETAWRAVGA